MPGVRVTLVSRETETPYSGMLPGCIAGFYAPEECQIDLWRLADFAGARLIPAAACGLDLRTRRLSLEGRPSLPFDVLSLDIGSTARVDASGADAHAIPVRPVSRFLARWNTLRQQARAGRVRSILVAGGGAAGVELALAMQARLSRECAAAGCPVPSIAIAAGRGLMPNAGARARKLVASLVKRRGVSIYNSNVAAVAAGCVRLDDGRDVEADATIWATGAAAAGWLRDTGLALHDGFVAVDTTLQSVNSAGVFAAGDVATMLTHRREKAGVHAVRQGPPLAINLERSIKGEPLRPFKPQASALALIGDGEGGAMAVRGRFAFHSEAVWRLKDWIDRRWMRRYQNLPAMAQAAPAAMGEMRCGGCGAKIPSRVLASVLQRLEADGAASLSLDALDDAAIFEARAPAVMQTVDFFRAFVDDPYLFGRIAANHCMSDIYAMGGTPTNALAILTIPPAPPAALEEDIYQTLRGALDAFTEAGAKLVGGHTAEAAELSLGFAVTAPSPVSPIRKGGLGPDDRLILTKPIGAGAILAAKMARSAPQGSVSAALRSMATPAGAAARILSSYATAMTDVTGFGLAGHMIEMLDASGCDASICMRATPLLPGFRDALRGGHRSTLHEGNSVARDRLHAAGVSELDLAILFDPQTAGGLLAGVPPDRSQACVAELRSAGYPDATIIGEVQARKKGSLRSSIYAAAEPESRPDSWSAGTVSTSSQR